MEVTGWQLPFPAATVVLNCAEKLTPCMHAGIATVSDWVADITKYKQAD